MSIEKKVVAVLFGGAGVEHDVSILTGILMVESMDKSIYTPLPIYIDHDGSWWHGQELLNKNNYPLSEQTKKKLAKLSLPVGEKFDEQPYFTISNASFLAPKKIFFDVIFLAFHGVLGETGHVQGMLDFVGIPYTGSRMLESSIFMNKFMTKALFREHGIPVLPDIIVKKSDSFTADDLHQYIKKHQEIDFPVCAKPCGLGSSVGIYKANNPEELYTAALDIFKIDEEMIIEPFVENLIEYNISSAKISGEIELSAIESPIRDCEILSFKDKYLSHGDLDSKLSIPESELYSSTRVFYPKLTKKQEETICNGVKKMYEALPNITGAPRIDCLSNEKTKEIWFNEVNPMPGSLAYYLWEARKPSEKKISITKLIHSLIQEAISENNKSTYYSSISHSTSVIFK